MLFLTRLICSCRTKWNLIRLLLLALILFTFMVQMLTNIRQLPGELAIHIHNSFLSGRFDDAKLVRKNYTFINSHQVLYDYIINEPNKCKGNVPFLILLVIGERWQQEARQAIRQTWGKEDFVPGVRMLRLFFLGKGLGWNDKGQRSLLEESRMFHDIIQQDYLDTYHNLSLKVIMGFNWISAHCPNASYVMKTDSDMFVNTEYLIHRLLKPDEPPKLNYFTGYLMINGTPIRNLGSKWYVPYEEYPEERYPIFCSGTGYVFSANLVHDIVQVSPSIRWIHLEDAFVGLCLDKLGVLPVAPPKLTDFNPWRVFYSDCEYNQIVTSHEMRPSDLRYLWNRLQKQKHKCVRTD
uniref:Hexosyltransferase n=1 Tax=Pyxicephalus adspersus TaxID=30357 RepID=A0AAV2ZP11_PYXAD|nr:TPA: hypothetical protein GDO54_003195 [Pyxicephalus adspersus]